MSHTVPSSPNCVRKRPQGKLVRRAVALTVVQGDDVQAVQQLPLILVDPLHMDVEHGGRVDSHPVLLLQEGRELQLIFLGRIKGKDSWRVHRNEPQELPSVQLMLSFPPGLRSLCPYVRNVAGRGLPGCSLLSHRKNMEIGRQELSG